MSQVENKSNVVSRPRFNGKTQDYWLKIVDSFKTEGKMFMYINLAGTEAREINDMTLEIGFPNGMSKIAEDFLSRPDIKQNLKEIIHMACGKEMQLKFIDQKKKDEAEFNEFEKIVGENGLKFNVI